MAKKGANKMKCKGYRDRGTRELNRAKRLSKHLKTHPTDADAKKALKA